MIKQRTFNLLRPVEPPPTIWDKVYTWIVINARIVILITELLIAFAFLGKIIEDTAAKNKDKQIEKERTELSFYSAEKEPLFRSIQDKVEQYEILWNSSSSYSDVLNEIYSYVSNSGSDVTIRINKSKVSVFGYVDLTALKELESAMKNSKTFENVYLDNLSLEKKEIQLEKGQYALIATLKNYKRVPLN